MSDYDYSTGNEALNDYPQDDNLYGQEDGQDWLNHTEDSGTVNAWDGGISFEGMEAFGADMGHSYGADMEAGQSAGEDFLTSPATDSHTTGEVSFTGKYSQAEIERMKSEVDSAKYNMKCRENDVRNWESKVSLNDTKKGHENGDYAHAVQRLNQAKSAYNEAVSRYNSAQSRLSNAL